MANTLHVLGAILLVGAIGTVDLRILGYGRGVSLPALERALVPLALAGFALMVLSGTVLFAADARALAGSPLFRAKLALIALAGLNALVFRRVWQSREAQHPVVVATAAFSLGLWVAIVIAGRWIAYA